MTRVLALTRYVRKGASSRVRFLQYVPHLEKLGDRIAVQSLLPEAYLDRLYFGGDRQVDVVAKACADRLAAVLRHRDVDVIWLQREIIPFAPFFIEKLLMSGRKLVIDFDDAHHLYYKSLKAGWAQTLFGDKIERLMRLADAVTVGNRTLSDYARAVGARNVHLIPSAVDTTHFSTAPAPDPFTVGWIGTPMTAEDAMPLVQAPLTRFLTETGARCVLVGVRPDQFPDIPAERIPWSEDSADALLTRMSVGLCPLADTEWNRGKSGYKIIQYMAAGRPSLVSPVGIAAELIADGLTGFHCRTPHDWYQGLMKLSRDVELRASCGHRAQDIAATTYDTAIAAEQIHAIFTQVCGA